ncbi:putative G-protein coupled receptor No9-like protein [Dinothrombium tinctorium]|uniref:Putative G-protein coupled receptor No9-like protein n=1 Tax=Dinothrombium tinctorium TaxID=1965070 RepID=A0A3S3NZ41_9ACAR|nr:putative G-protein coupled receptor No9-like protein [Dinothrombium tinctorium]
MDKNFVLVTSNKSEDASDIFTANHTICSVEEVVQDKLEDPLIIVAVLICVIINAAVIAGNILVIVAVFFSSKLRTITNFFIVSLAVSDLLLGVAILPYSLPLHVFEVWLFGDVWCMGWLVIDVWLTTASILNLCAISIDRYLAVTRPVRYRSIMTSRKAKLMIAAVWILSFVICFPPLIGWSNKGSVIFQDQGSLDIPSVITNIDSFSSNASLTFVSHNKTISLLNASSTGVHRDSIPYKKLSVVRNNVSVSCYHVSSQCALFDEKTYVIYSALGSFFIPMSVMLFFYWRIYLVASRTTSALKRGYKTKKSTKSRDGGGHSEERLTLRIHRGYMCDDQPASTSLVTYIHNRSSSTKSNKSVNSLSTSPRARTGILKQSFEENQNCTEMKNLGDNHTQRRKLPITVYRSPRLSANMAMNQQQIERERSPSNQSNQSHSSISPSSSTKDSDKTNCKSLAVNRFNRRTNTGKWHARRFLAETKAAKTVGIIVGAFIFCWFPFFSVYLFRAFYKDQIPETVVSLFYWFGYFNSAVNPIIYGLFSRDFRRAFKNIVCKCRFREETGVTSLIRQIHLPNLFEEDIVNNEDILKSQSRDN